ncbi:MAG: hypothetical protein VB876_07285, partial [Pirellulales bacterium]
VIIGKMAKLVNYLQVRRCESGENAHRANSHRSSHGASSTMGDVFALPDNVELQNMLQKQQQTLQVSSNISKQLHDTALSVIRKIG